MNSEQVKKDLKKVAKSEKISILSRFFKTGPGEYGEGDIFWGIDVPNQRRIAKKYTNTQLEELIKLLQDEVHECRLTALLIMVEKYQKADEEQKEKIYKLYLNNTTHINNWDLVDLSAPKIVGDWLYRYPNQRKILYKLSKSSDLWQRRIAVIACYTFIKNNDYKDIISLSKNLLDDKHDLIHKAVGWMLREIGKRNVSTLRNFLDEYHKKMPRTMLRYSIEKLDEKERKKYMKK